jgi:UDP-N-acetylmuramate: L-alanyl-gamma-D-glutamyl-meso-diaminopimelate ligase
MKGKKVYMIAVCGIGMGSLAGYLREAGAEVSGSDDNIYPPMSTLLDSLGIEIKKGFAASNVPADADYIIVGNAVSKTNPEAQKISGSTIPYFSLPSFLEKNILPGKQSLVVAGTHGKTTTTSMLGWCLEAAGEDPSVLVGGVVKGWEKSYRHGNGRYFVIEGDEYDTAFFDKVPKFLHYMPYDLVLTGIEFDHADIYSDVEAIKIQFAKLVGLLPKEGKISAYGENDHLIQVLKKSGRTFTTYGFGEGLQWRGRNLTFNSEFTEFDIYKAGKKFLEVKAPFFGKQNVLNSLGVVSLLDSLGMKPALIKKGLETFPGVKRRQEVIARIKGITLIEDFAHHPTAVELTIEGIRLANPDSRIWALFEPRTNTSRRGFFQDQLPGSFKQADKVIIAKVFNEEKLKDGEALDAALVVKRIKATGKDASYIPDIDQIVDLVAREATKGDIVLIMSNGSFGGIYERLIKAI